MKFDTQQLLFADAVLSRAKTLKASALQNATHRLRGEEKTNAIAAWQEGHPTTEFVGQALAQIKEVAMLIQAA